MSQVVRPKYPGAEPLDFAPVDETIKKVLTETGVQSGLLDVAESLNFGLANFFTRGSVSIWRDPPTFEGDFDSVVPGSNVPNDFVWRQPISPGSEKLTFRFRIRSSLRGVRQGDRMAALQIIDKNGIWITTNFELPDDQGYDWVTIKNVELGPTTEGYVDVRMRGFTSEGRRIMVYSMGVREVPLESLAPFSDLPPFTYRDYHGVDTTRTVNDDEPLSAGAVEEMSRSIAYLYDMRVRAHVCRTMVKGTGADVGHGSNWESTTETNLA